MPEGKRKRAGSTFATALEQHRTGTRDESSSDALRVLVASQVRLLQEGVAALLERLSGVRVVGKTSLMHAPARAEQLSPDIVLFDATRPINLEYAKHLAGLTPAPKLVAFGVAETDAEIVELATIGIAGYARDDAAPEDVLAVLTSAMRGELLCSPRAAA